MYNMYKYNNIVYTPVHAHVCNFVMHAYRLALKLLDKKRIKVKKSEYLAVNERNMLAKVCIMT